MIDYPPLQSPKALKKYYDHAKKEEKINPVPLISVAKMISIFKEEERFKSYQSVWEQFTKTHPQVKYVMIDGKHRSTAMTLAGKKIKCRVIQSDQDTKELFDLKQKRKLKIAGIKQTLKETILILEKHFFEKKYFWTVEEKIKLMIINKDIPKEMIKK